MSIGRKQERYHSLRSRRLETYTTTLRFVLMRPQRPFLACKDPNRVRVPKMLHCSLLLNGKNVCTYRYIIGFVFAFLETFGPLLACTLHSPPPVTTDEASRAGTKCDRFRGAGRENRPSSGIACVRTAAAES